MEETAQSTDNAPTTKAPTTKAPTTGGRAPLIFAVVGIVIALAAGGLYLVTRTTAPPRLTPEETVREFLSAIFLANDPGRVGAVVCGSWDPQDALTRTTREIETDAHVSWDQVQVLSATDDRASARARLGIRRRDDVQPSVYRQWRFSLVDEEGWRVCEARPFTI